MRYSVHEMRVLETQLYVVGAGRIVHGYFC